MVQHRHRGHANGRKAHWRGWRRILDVLHEEPQRASSCCDAQSWPKGSALQIRSRGSKSRMPVMIPITIVCGGKGKRLAPITTKIPKSLVPVLGKPFIYWQLELLAAKKFKYVVLCVGHMANQIRDAVGNGNQFGLDVDYSYDETPGQGTVAALQGAFEMLGPMFCTLYGDSYLPCSYKTIIRVFRNHDYPALMTVYRNKDYGLGVFLRVAFANYHNVYTFNIIDQYKHLYKHKNLFVYNMKHRFYEIGSYPGLTQTEEYLERHPKPLASRVVRLS